jgi:hypothetical protein
MQLERTRAEIAQRISNACVVPRERLFTFAARMADIEIRCERRNAKLQEVMDDLSRFPAERAD